MYGRRRLFLSPRSPAAAAERELREAVRLKDTNAAAHANLGPVLCALGKLDEGIYHLERAREIPRADRSAVSAPVGCTGAHGPDLACENREAARRA